MTSPLIVTVDHCVVVEGPGGPRELCAGELSIGMKVLCGQHPENLTQVRRYRAQSSVIRIRFEPDHAVEAFLAPSRGILSKGGLRHYMDGPPTVIPRFELPMTGAEHRL